METPKMKRRKNEEIEQEWDDISPASDGVTIPDPNLVLPRCKKMLHHYKIDEEMPEAINKLEELEYEIPESLPKFILDDKIAVFAGDVMTKNKPKTVNNNTEPSNQPSEQESFGYNKCYIEEYDEDKYIFERELEAKYTLKENFLEVHYVNPTQRENALDYLLHICNFMELPTDILHLSVAIFDRFLQKLKRTPIQYLQPLVIAALRIALKLEHCQSALPSTNELVLLCENVFSSFTLVAIEKKICSVLDFTLIYPTSISFLRRCNRLAGVTVLQHFLGRYLLEVGFLNYRTCATKPSLLAAAACCFSVALLQNETDLTRVWSSEMEKKTSYNLSDLRPIIRDLANGLIIMENVGTNSNLYKKYEQINNFKISTFQQLRNEGILKKYM